MREHPDWCDKVDDPRALAAWKSNYPPRLEIVCLWRKHRLGAVYDATELGGLVLCEPAFSGLARDFFLFDDPDDPDGATEIHYHASLRRLDEIDPDEMSPYGRCHCHTSSYSVEQIRAGLERPEGLTRRGTAFIYARLSSPLWRYSPETRAKIMARGSGKAGDGPVTWTP